MNSSVKSSRLDRADRQIALVAFALALAVYLRGVAPDVLSGDAGEFQVAASQWGLAHPTGYPLYLILGGLWQRVLGVVGVSPAHALNIFSALISAVAVSVLYLLLRRWLWEVPVLGRMAAIWATFLFGVNPTFWSQSLVAEVYTLHVLLLSLILFVAQGLSLPGRWNGETAAPIHLVPRQIAALAFLVGLGLAHHGMTLFVVPGLLIYLTLLDRRWWRNLRTWVAGALALVAPLLLYLYVPLRSGPAASPWYHQRLGEGTLTLYDGNFQAFLDFITGRSISVGFYDLGGALGQVGQAATLWRIHLTWAGLVVAVAGLFILLWQRNWPVLALTLPLFVLQQLFNFFYAIGDILVYYIPLYLVACIWAGFGAYGLATGLQRFDAPSPSTPASPPSDQSSAGSDATGEIANESALGTYAIGAMALVLLFWIPLNLRASYADLLSQAGERQARADWEEILAAEPPDDAILISNDRNEIVPLFYLQAVEGRATGMSGLFPLIAPDARFADVATTIDTALVEGGEQPVLLIKAMPGLEVKYALQEANAPLVQVLGPAIEDGPQIIVNHSYGPLTLLGYDWDPDVDGVRIQIYWQVKTALPADYTTTVQLFDDAGAKVAQDDRPPGGDYYPTSLWKPGEVLVDKHVLALEGATAPATLLVGMYTGADFELLTEPLHLPLVVE